MKVIEIIDILPQFCLLEWIWLHFLLSFYSFPLILSRQIFKLLKIINRTIFISSFWLLLTFCLIFRFNWIVCLYLKSNMRRSKLWTARRKSYSDVYPEFLPHSDVHLNKSGTKSGTSWANLRQIEKWRSSIIGVFNGHIDDKKILSDTLPWVPIVPWNFRHLTRRFSTQTSLTVKFGPFNKHFQ